jgi:hypothetical protein
MTASTKSPVWISSPPMMTGISISSDAIVWSLSFSSCFSGLPGAYEKTGSLTGIGTWMSLMPICSCITVTDRARTVHIVGYLKK